MRKQSFVERYKESIIAEPSGKTFQQLQSECEQQELTISNLVKFLKDNSK